MEDRYDLQRFIQAQDPIYEQVCSELRTGRKRSHWMWFIFPQISGLGRSDMAQRFAISSLEEAIAYLNHPVLGARLEECTRFVNAVNGSSVEQIFGYPDNMKFHSSMTLFSRAAPANDVFSQALKKYFDGQLDAPTLQRLASLTD
jgi:uncharacterized protein (DUF1810 family)